MTGTNEIIIANGGTISEDNDALEQEAACSAWLCRFGWHKWSKWQMGECTTTSIFYKEERGELCQVRKCQQCGKTQVETLED